MIIKNTNWEEELDLSVSYKMNSLLFILNKAVKKFDEIANRNEDRNIKMAFLGISAQLNQYSNELGAQLKSLKVKPVETKGFLLTDIFFENLDNETSNVFAICESIEDFITKAYMDIIRNEMPYYFLKQMFRYQFDAIEGAFVRMKLLDLILA